MLAKQPLNELAERRRLLVMEAELHRGLIGVECENLRARLARLQAAPERVAANPLWVAGSVAAGALIARRWRQLAPWIKPAFAALRWWQALRRK